MACCWLGLCSGSRFISLGLHLSDNRASYLYKQEWGDAVMKRCLRSRGYSRVCCFLFHFLWWRCSCQSHIHVHAPVVISAHLEARDECEYPSGTIYHLWDKVFNKSGNLSFGYASSPASPESACFLRAGVTGMLHMPSLFTWVLELNSYPHACMASMLPTEPAPSPFHYFVKSVYVWTTLN